MAPILEVMQLEQCFGSVRALHQVSFSMQQGEVICILGPSGCGKSTLLQLIAGLQTPSSGEIYIENQLVASSQHAMPPEKRRINMVFQDYALWPHMNVYNNISYGLKRKGLTKQEQQDQVDELMALLRLEGLAYRLPAHLSGGQQQRVGIARALATKPSILLMDEPLSNLDMKLRMEMRNELSFLLRQLGMTVLYVTHDTAEAFAIADKILILRAGRIEQFAPPQDVFEQPLTSWSAQLMGYTNHLDCPSPLTHFDPDGYVGVTIDDGVVRGRISPTMKSEHFDPQSGRFFFHPEHAKLSTLSNGSDVSDAPTVSSSSASDVSCNVMKGTVKYSVFEGTQWRNWIEIPGGQLISVPSHHPVAANAKVQVKFPAHSTFFYLEDNVDAS